MAHSMGVLALRVEMDSRVVVNMVELRRSHSILLRPLLEEALLLLLTGWYRCITCTGKQIFVQTSWRRWGIWVAFNGLCWRVPQSLVLHADVLGVSTSRVIS